MGYNFNLLLVVIFYTFDRQEKENKLAKISMEHPISHSSMVSPPLFPCFLLSTSAVVLLLLPCLVTSSASSHPLTIFTSFFIQVFLPPLSFLIQSPFPIHIIRKEEEDKWRFPGFLWCLSLLFHHTTVEHLSITYEASKIPATAYSKQKKTPGRQYENQETM